MRRIPVFLCLLISMGLAIDSFGQRRHGPSPLDTLGEETDQQLGWEILKEYQSLGIVQDYQFRFRLKVMPRRGKSRYVDGTMIGSRNGRGPISRLDLIEKASVRDDLGKELEKAVVRRLLLQNGPSAYGWESGGLDATIPGLIAPESYFEALAGSELSVFDLLMPYAFWQNFYYEGRTELRGRPTHVFWMYPPVNDEMSDSEISGVRLYIDQQFHYPIRVRVYDSDKELVKTLSIQNFKKVDGVWLIDSFDVRNEKTRDKTRFDVVHAEVGLDLDESFFTPQGLTESIDSLRTRQLD